MPELAVQESCTAPGQPADRGPQPPPAQTPPRVPEKGRGLPAGQATGLADSGELL